MCLLITGKSAELRSTLLDTPGLIQDIYGFNSDGLGVMYVTTHGLKVIKTLPAGVAKARKTLEALPSDDRQVAVHFRFRTHGDVDKANCHPYQVNGKTWLMHNGVLSTGNDADKAKSDTAHFVDDYLRDLPDDTLHNERFLTLVGEFINNNRFAIMSADGRLSVVNEEQGVHHGGLWFSNTYAWSPEILIPTYVGRSYTFGYLGYSADMEPLDRRWSRPVGKPHATAADVEYDMYDGGETDEALYQFDIHTLADLLEEEFDDCVDHIFASYKITPYSRYLESEWSIAYNAAVSAWVDGDKEALRGIDPAVVAEAMIHCCDWDEKPYTSMPQGVEADTPRLALVQ